jgi:hypothetical protein
VKRTWSWETASQQPPKLGAFTNVEPTPKRN